MRRGLRELGQREVVEPSRIGHARPAQSPQLSAALQRRRIMRRRCARCARVCNSIFAKASHRGFLPPGCHCGMNPPPSPLPKIPGARGCQRNEGGSPSAVGVAQTLSTGGMRNLLSLSYPREIYWDYASVTRGDLPGQNKSQQNVNRSRRLHWPDLLSEAVLPCEPPELSRP